ncbi:MAG: His/Gly/Thr/Pro-type tRNA ligase C-terminal domain-containing protein, partial [Proteobacteria bacterium]|nr:His/Gly/Thr/Pro-type tRNA ligase C-terminal domain-containing protein [Pseudomonadota bacterium]
DQVQGCRVLVHCGDGKFKSQLKKADASGASLALILGEEEISSGTIGVKSLRTGEQVKLDQEALTGYCLEFFGKEKGIG